MDRKTLASLALAVAGLLSLGFVAGLSSRPKPGASAECPPGEDAPASVDAPPREPAAERRTHRSLKRPFVTRPLEMFSAAGSGAEDRYLEAQAEDVMKLLRIKLRLQLGAAPPNSSPEAVAMLVAPWLFGMADGIVRTGPDLMEALANQIETATCAAGTDPAALIAMSLLMKTIPETASPKTFECALARPDEDAVLWHALEAFTASGLPKPAAMLELEARAEDPRTRRRLLTRDERIAAFEAERARIERGDPETPVQQDSIEYLPLEPQIR
jgi:hypothetical protein